MSLINKNNKSQNGILEIENYVQKAATKIATQKSFDVVTTGIIRESEPGGNYKVALIEGGNENLISAIALDTNKTFQENDYVYLLTSKVAKGDLFEWSYYIFGLVSKTNEFYYNANSYERFNAFDSKWNGSKEKYIGVYKGETEVASLELQGEVTPADIQKLFTDIKETSTFSFSGYFTCTNQNVKDYGIKIKFYNKENENPVYTIVFNYEWFSGQPFNMTEQLQRKIWTLNSSFDFDKIKISAFAEFKDGYAAADDEIAFMYNELSIQAGVLMALEGEFLATIKAVNNKNYFYKTISENENDEIELRVDPTHNGQSLFNSSLQYYWFLKKVESEAEGSINNDPNRSLTFLGDQDDWICINSYIESDTIHGVKVPVWTTKKRSTLKLARKTDESGNVSILTNDGVNVSENLSNFKNQLKCIIKYQGVLIESENFDIINYNKEDFELVVTSEPAQNRYLILPTDTVKFTAKVNSKNKIVSMSDYTIEYNWYVNKEEDPIYSGTTLTVEYGKNDGEAVEENGVYKITSDTKFKCVAIVKKGEDTISTEESESFLVESKVQIASELETNTYYKYYVTTDNEIVNFFKEPGTYKLADEEAANEGETYYKQVENGDFEPLGSGENPNVYFTFDSDSGLTGNWKIFDDSNGVEEDYFISKNGEKYLKDKDGYNFLYSDDVVNPAEGSWCLIFCTSREVIKEDGKIIRTTDWSYPTVIRKVCLGADGNLKDLLNELEANQFNAFLSLTNNGTIDTISWVEGSKIYLEKGTDNPDASVQYFYQAIYPNTDNKFYYTPVQLEGWKFIEGKKYFEKDVDGGFSETEDTIPNLEKKYYKENKDENGNSYYTYIEFSPANFDDSEVTWPVNDLEDTKYYYDIKNQLYINATYIRSGTLEVKDKFRASINNDEVTIGGFEVDANQLISKNGKLGLNSDDSDTDNIAIWAGNKDENNTDYPFYVQHNGFLKSNFASIGGWDVELDRIVSKFNQENSEGVIDIYSTGLKTINPNLPKGIAFWAGGIENTDKVLIKTPPFYVQHDGYFYSTYGNIGGWSVDENSINSNDVILKSKNNTNDADIYTALSIGKGLFTVDSNGFVKATEGRINNINIFEKGISLINQDEQIVYTITDEGINFISNNVKLLMGNYFSISSENNNTMCVLNTNSLLRIQSFSGNGSSLVFSYNSSGNNNLDKNLDGYLTFPEDLSYAFSFSHSIVNGKIEDKKVAMTESNIKIVLKSNTSKELTPALYDYNLLHPLKVSLKVSKRTSFGNESTSEVIISLERNYSNLKILAGQSQCKIDLSDLVTTLNNKFQDIEIPSKSNLFTYELFVSLRFTYGDYELITSTLDSEFNTSINVTSVRGPNFSPNEKEMENIKQTIPSLGGYWINVKGDFRPQTNSYFELGANKFRWKSAFIDTLYLGEGNVSLTEDDLIKLKKLI